MRYFVSSPNGKIIPRTPKIKQDFHHNYNDLVKHHGKENALDVFSTATFDFCEDSELDIFAFLNKLRLSIEYEL